MRQMKLLSLNALFYFYDKKYHLTNYGQHQLNVVKIIL